MSNVTDSFAFILTPIKPEIELDIEIIDGVYLSKATEDEITKIKSYIASYGPSLKRTYYEAEAGRSGSGGLVFRYLPPSEWRYFVLRFNYNPLSWNDLAKVLGISKEELHLGKGFTVSGEYPGEFYKNAPTDYNYWDRLMHRAEPPQIAIIGVDEIAEYSKLYSLYKESTKSFPWLENVLEMFRDLEGIPVFDRLYSVGLFITLEALITHAPGERETGDSISRQLTSKMRLLEHRVDGPFDQSMFISAMSPETLWKKLYKFRSSLAHGGTPDFSSKDLKALQNRDAVNLFMRDTLKALIRGALKEPQLYEDLKNC